MISETTWDSCTDQIIYQIECGTSFVRQYISLNSMQCQVIMTTMIEQQVDVMRKQ